MLVDEFAVYLEIFTDALNHLEVDVVYSRSAGNEIFCGFLIADSDLNPFITAQVVSNPALASSVLTANPVAEQLTIVCVSLALNCLKIHEVTAEAHRPGRIG